MLKVFFEFILGLFESGRRLTAATLSLLALLVSAELAQSHLLGSSAFRVASKFVPWDPILAARASLHASFELEVPGKSTQLMKDDAAPCPVDSRISIEFQRSRAGYIAALGITKPFQNKGSQGVFGLTSDDISAVLFEAKEMQRATAQISAPDGLELFVVVGADKPFDPLEDVVPALRELKDTLGKGGQAQLAGYDLDWTDTPVIVSCTSM